MGELTLSVKNYFGLPSIINHLRTVMFISDLLVSEWSQKGSGGNNKRNQTNPNCADTGRIRGARSVSTLSKRRSAIASLFLPLPGALTL